MQTLSVEDNLHVMSKPVVWEKYEKWFNMSSAEIFSRIAKS